MNGSDVYKRQDLDNAIVIYERKMSQESYDKLADVMGVPHMDADQLGYINHKPLVWPEMSPIEPPFTNFMA